MVPGARLGARTPGGICSGPRPPNVSCSGYSAPVPHLRTGGAHADTQRQSGPFPSNKGALWGPRTGRAHNLRSLPPPRRSSTSACATFSPANEAVYFKDTDSRFLLVSRGVVATPRRSSAQERFQPNSSSFGPEDFVGKTDLDLFDPELALEWIAEEQRIMETRRAHGRASSSAIRSFDGPGGWFQTSKAPLRDDDGTIIGTFGISRDVTAQIEAQQELLRREAQLRAVLDSSPDAIACYNPDLRYEMVNAKAVALLGVAADQVVGRTDAELGRSPEVVATVLEGLHRVLATREMCEVEYSTEAEGATNWWHVRMVPNLAADGAVTGVITATRDLTELKAAQSVLAHQALHDPLTGLLNRLALIDRLNHALADLERNPGRIALLFIDLDNFKLINDARGHDVGDQLLVEVAVAPDPGHAPARTPSPASAATSSWCCFGPRFRQLRRPLGWRHGCCAA